MAELSIQRLIEYFINRLKEINKKELEEFGGKEPNYPLLLVYLGDKAISAHNSICRYLTITWPQYEPEIGCIGVRISDGLPSYLTSNSMDNNEMREISEMDVRAIASSLFGLKTHYRDRSKLLVYYVLDTSDIRSIEQIEEWAKAIEAVKIALGVGNLDILEMVAILLNEDFSHKQIANDIRNWLCSYNTSDGTLQCNSVLLLSNRRDDSIILEDWNLCYRIISAVIRLSDNSDSRITSSFFANSILTASYDVEEKPTAEIGQVVINSIINELEHRRTATSNEAVSFDDTLLGRLGIAENGTFDVVKEYARSFSSLLPSEAELELFPRRDDTNYGSMCELFADEFDEITLGAWTGYLAMITEKVKSKMSVGTAIHQDWKNAFASHFVAEFSLEELIFLKNHTQQIEVRLSQRHKPPISSRVLQSALEQIAYMLSTSAVVNETFIDALREQGDLAEDFVNAWQRLISSRRRMFMQKDSNIETFYSRRVREFFDYNWSNISKEFITIRTRKNLELFLEKIIDRIISDDKTFLAPFEEELDARLNEESFKRDAKSYIRDKLTKEGQRTYLQVNFGLKMPIASCLLLKKGSQLHKSLIDNLPNTIYYYDTGNGNAAESIEIFEVTKDNLING